MFDKRITLFTIAGFEVKIDISWLIIAILIVWSLAQSVFPLYDRNLSQMTYWIMAIIGAIGLFASIIAHELCHSLVARRYGLPMRGITLFLFGGVAEMEDEPPSPIAEFAIAIAGPLSSIAIGALFFVLLGVGRLYDWMNPVLILFSYLGTINIVLAIFNLLPAFPLDGGRVFRALLWMWKHNLTWATKVASSVGSGFGLFLIFTGIFFVFAGGIVSGVWWTLIGLFLRSASKMSYQTTLIKSALNGDTVKKFLKTEPVLVSPDVTVDHLVEDYIYKYHYKMYPVLRSTDNVQCVTLKDVKTIPREEWKQHTVAELSHPCSIDNSIDLDDDAINALTVMNKTGNNRLMVIDEGGKLVGIVALRDLVKYLSMKLDLNEDEFRQSTGSDE